MYLDNQFLNVVQAVEAYHRIRCGGTDLPEDEYESKLKEILDATPSAHRAWLREELRYSNELSLRKRLRELMEETGSILAPVWRNATLFIQKVVATRNYMTHWTPELRKEAERRLSSSAEPG
jgi:hypothetical protein